MKNTISIIVFLNGFLLFGQAPNVDPHWEIDWQDDFNFFNDTIWRKANYCDHAGEPQLYLNQNVTTSNGNLVITLKKEDVIYPINPPVNVWECGSCIAGVKNYTSGMVISQITNLVLYGYIESRIKLPYGIGYWPAFWTYIQPLTYQEIDIFEMVPGRLEDCTNASFEQYTHNYNHLTSNMHDGTTNSNFFCTTNFKSFSINDYRQWHKYAIEWSPSKIIFYVDDIPIRIEANDNKFDATNIIFNLALNNHNFSSNYNYGNLNYGETAEMIVDYIKVYKLKNNCKASLNVCNYNFSNHDNKVKKDITIGNGSCNNSLNSGDNVVLRASDGIIINGNFTVPIGANLYLDVNTCY